MSGNLYRLSALQINFHAFILLKTLMIVRTEKFLIFIKGVTLMLVAKMSIQRKATGLSEKHYENMSI